MKTFRTVVLLSVLTFSGCAPMVEDMLALSAEAQKASPSGSGVAEHEIGRDGPWKLVFLPKGASEQALLSAGLDRDIAKRIGARSPTFREQPCVVFVDDSTLAFSEWPPASGVVSEVLVATGRGRRLVQVQLSHSAAGTQVVSVSVKN